MAYYSVLAVTPTSQEWMADYVAPTNAAVARHGGEYLARTATHEQVEGSEQSAALRVLIKWPSREAAMAFMNDPEYLPHLEARQAGSESVHFLVAGDDDLA